MMLDATAGNRLMWKQQKPESIIFLDRETRLKNPPDVFADNRFCPFRDGVFDCIIYDPPFMSRRNPPQYWDDPQMTEYKNTRGFMAKNAFWGVRISKAELLSSLHHAQKEFQRLSNRLCLKWNEMDWSLWKILPFFKEWTMIQKKGFKQSRDKKRGMQSYLSSSDDPHCKTWWITFINSEFKEKSE